MKLFVIFFLFFIFTDCAKFKKNKTNLSTLEGLILTRVMSNSYPVELSITIDGFSSGSLVLNVNNSDYTLTAPSSGFTLSYTKDTDYSITIKTQPVSHTCSISNGTGNSGRYGISNIIISCY